MEYRAMPEADRARFHEIASYAFQPENPDPDIDPEGPAANMGSKRALYDDADAPRAICRHHWFETRVRGEWLSTPGLSAVATPPEHRREGHVKRLLAESLAEYRERGDVLSLLWPFEYEFYAAFGWETTNRRTTVECPPDALAGTRGRGDGTWRPAEPDEWRALDRVYEDQATPFDLALDRTEAWWRHRVFERWTTEPYVYLLERGDEPVAYLVYAVDEDDGKTLTVQDVAYRDHEAFLGCLAFLSQHDSQVETVRLPQPPDEDLYALVDGPGELEVTVDTGPMARLVDVADGLERLSDPTGDSLDLTLAVTDPLADWNDGCVGLTVSDGDASCERVEREPDCTLSVGALTELAVGARPAGDLQQTDDLDGASTETVAALEAAFPPRTTYLREFF